MIYDTIVIGKGPAGITAALYLKRYGHNPIIIAKDGGALERVHKIENYYGIPVTTGPELLEIGINQAKAFDIPLFEEEVLDISYDTIYTITTNLSSYQAKTIILACGTSRNKFALAKDLTGVSYCATCDGFFYRKKKIALIGNGNYMAHELSVLKNIIQDIIVFTDGLPLSVNISKEIPVVLDKIDEVRGDGKIQSLVVQGKEYFIDGCFVAIGNASGFTLAKHLGIALENNRIVVDKNYMTNLEGLFACGDVIGGLLQISKSTGDGASCATAVSNYLKVHNL